MRPKNDERKMEVYFFITSFIKDMGVCPTTLEISEALGMAKSTVSKYMNRLIDEGLIERYGRYQTKAQGSLSCTRMPIVGEVACGTPRLAIENVEGYLPIDEKLLGAGEYFGLIASGDSMINAGINDGDTVYVRRQDTADNGQIVVAICDGDVTLKRIYFNISEKKYCLHPENDNYKDIVLEKVEILGIAVKVVKDL
jgi:repressor LexA